MCGILGYFAYSSTITNQVFGDALLTMLHRGPDDQSVMQFNSGYLGHLRLAIIDLDKKSNQPFTLYNRYHIVFNGEIYNFLNLKEKLEVEYNVVFNTNSDTEVLLQAYIKVGVKCLEWLNGMFAFAIFDSLENKIFAARDRVGKKPFYYHLEKGKLIFSSELKGLVPLLDRKPKLSQYSICEFLSIGYIIAPRTIYENIFKLEPGHFLQVDLNNYDYKKVKYWDIIQAETGSLCNNVESLIKDSIGIRYVSDVPVGIMLSGGLDSNIILALSKNRKPKTFTIKNDNAIYDEEELARYAATTFDCENVSEVSKPDPKVIDNLVYIFDEPMADSSAIPSLLLCNTIHKNGYKCAMNGDGADEIFAGYDRYRFLLFYKKYRFIRKLIPKVTSFSYKSFLYNLAKLKRLLSEKDIYHAYAQQNLINNGFEGEKLEGMDYKNEIVKRLATIPIDNLNKFLIYDYKFYLPDDLLVKMDRASMANSVEGRSPFLDYRLAECLSKVSFSTKISLRSNKKILRSLFNRILPERILKEKKRGFQVPIDYWFLNELREEIIALKDGPAVKHGYIKKEYIDTIVDAHLSGRENFKFQIYIILIFDKWYQRWVGE